MTHRRVGLWLVGAYGGVATTITLGLSAMSRRLRPTTALVSELPMFDGLDLVAPADVVVGGHEIREGSFEHSVEEFRHASGVFDPALLAACRDDLVAATSRVRPGTTLGAGPAIERIANWERARASENPAAIVERLAADIDAFAAENKLAHVVVLNVSSTEPPFGDEPEHASWAALKTALGRGGEPVVPASTLYALAALGSGHTYINFTPSLGASIPAAYELAESTGALHAGKDGKTGETLMKTVLAPMFAHRNLEVLSWVGHNIFGNRDGEILDDPRNKSSKVETKDRVITEILGYKPRSLVTIEYLPDMGDWKTAWDHIHFAGFLGTKMTLQFTWQGCDSLLAAPLGIDLMRLADLEKRHGGRGLMAHLCSFFKSPEGVETNDFFAQFDVLRAHVDGLRKSQSAAAPRPELAR